MKIDLAFQKQFDNLTHFGSNVLRRTFWYTYKKALQYHQSKYYKIANFYRVVVNSLHNILYYSPARRATQKWAAEVSSVSHRLAQLEILSSHSGRSERVLLALQAVNLAEVSGNRQLLADTYVTAALVFKDYMPKIGNWLCG